MKTLILGLGNDLLGDDGIGLAAVEALREEMAERADVVGSSESGLALLEYFLDYDRAVIIDAIQTGQQPAGHIRTFRPEELGRVLTPSPHYTGLPEMIALAEQLRLTFPRDIVIFAVEVLDPHTIGGSITPPVQAALPALLNVVREQIALWESAPVTTRNQKPGTRNSHHA